MGNWFTDLFNVASPNTNANLNANADVDARSEANATLLPPGDAPDIVNSRNATKLTDASTEQMANVGAGVSNAASWVGKGTGIGWIVNGLSGLGTMASNGYTAYQKGQATKKQAKAEIAARELEQKKQAKLFLEQRSKREPFQTSPENKKAASLACFTIREQVRQVLNHSETSEAYIAAVVNG